MSNPIEFLRVVPERLVAASGNVGDNGADGRFDVGRSFAFSVEKRAEFLRKIAGADVEADGHHDALYAMRATRISSLLL